MVWKTSSDGSTDFFNQRFRDYTGLSLQELRGLGWMNALHPEDRRIEEWRAALAAGTYFDWEGLRWSDPRRMPKTCKGRFAVSSTRPTTVRCFRRVCR
ncbi:PAS domain-containing protein [Bradyrhizobium tropiciagri]|uniref:PAS domain-containing protein n=1 Tax=Bradyrhizobium tropiciagri TaxID=312253 RepID=UPI003D3221F2